MINQYKNERSWLEEIVLYYLEEAYFGTYTGSMAEAAGTTVMIDGFEWTSSGVAFTHTGTLGEAAAVAEFVEV